MGLSDIESLWDIAIARASIIAEAAVCPTFLARASLRGYRGGGYFLMTDRAVELVEYVEEIASDIFLIQSATMRIRHTVDLRGKTCGCPDWTYHGSVIGLPCKHLMAAWQV